jgi:hypothetical protein
MLVVVTTTLRNRADRSLMVIVMTLMVDDNEDILFRKVTGSKCFDDSNQNASYESEEHRRSCLWHRSI